MLFSKPGFGLFVLFVHYATAVLLEPHATQAAEIVKTVSLASMASPASMSYLDRITEEFPLKKRQATTTTTSASSSSSSVVSSSTTSTATTATTATVVATPRPNIANGGNWQYEGCFWDNPKGSTFPVGPYGTSTDGNRTVENCVQICVNGGYTMAAVENTFECWCGSGSSINAQQLQDNLCSSVCPGNAGEICGGNPDRFLWYVLSGAVTTRGPLSSSIASVSRKSVSSASRASVSSVASVSRARASSLAAVSRSSVTAARSSLSSVASVSRASVLSSKLRASSSRSSARSSKASSRSSVTSIRSVATLSQQTSRLSRSSVRSSQTSAKLASISSRKASLTSSLLASRSSASVKKASSLSSKLVSIASASSVRASISSARSLSAVSASSSRSAASASRSSALSVSSAALAGTSYRAIGCYNHTAANPALSLHPLFGEMSNNHCAYKCAKHLYMGLFNGDQCWCGDQIYQTAVNFSLCFFGLSQGCDSIGAYTQDCGSAVNMYILGKVSYFGMCDNTNPMWSGKCQAIPALPFYTTTTTTAAAKRTAIPIGGVPFVAHHAGVDTLPYHLESLAEGTEEDPDDDFDEDGYLKIKSLADIIPSEAEPTTVV